jgi:hypothetical protein
MRKPTGGLPDFEDDGPSEADLEPPRHIVPPPDAAAYGGEPDGSVGEEDDIPPDEITRRVYPPPPDDSEAYPYDPPYQNPAQTQTGAQRVQSDSIHGALYAFAGKVLKVYYDASPAYHPDTKRGGDIDVQMADINWGANNVPVLTAKPRGGQEPTPGVVVASPWPARNDQPKYIVKAGDDVTVLASADGRYYFMADDLPFVGEVLDTTRDLGEDEGGPIVDTKESNFGGSGNGDLNVRRVLVTGLPSTDINGDNAKVFNDVPLTGIYYKWVKPLVGPGVHAGYRTGDYVLCFRRGNYVYALPTRGVYLGVTVNKGPADEADQDGAFHWVAVTAFGVGVQAGNKTNYWNWDDVNDDVLFTVSAFNLDSSEHLAAGMKVQLTLHAASDTGGGGRAGYWTFQKATSTSPVADALCIDTVYSPIHRDGSGGFTEWPGTATDVTVALADQNSQAEYLFATLHFYRDEGTPDLINPFVVFRLPTGTGTGITPEELPSKFCSWDSTLSGTRIGEPSYLGDSTMFYAEGVMYSEEAEPHKLNPRVAFDPGGFLCTSAASITSMIDASGQMGDTNCFYVQGVMYRDAGSPSKFNPRIPIDPSKFLCIGVSEPGTYEMTGAAPYYVRATHYQDSTSHKYNPWVQLPIYGDGAGVYADSWILVEGSTGVIAVSHGDPGVAVDQGIAGTGGLLGLRRDGKGHVVQFMDSTGWHDFGPIP